MNDNIEIKQNASRGSESTNIAVQNNYNGMSPEEASNLAINLFMENFPKLQQLAKETIEKRVNEFCCVTVEKLLKERISDFSSFSDPDVQCVLLEAEKNYARLGTEELLNNLSDLIVERIKYNHNFYLKIVINKAISVVGSLSQSQIDALTMLFFYKNVIFRGIRTLDDLKEHFDHSCEFLYPCGRNGYSLLNSLGCLELDLANVVERCSKTYSLNKNEIECICPQQIKSLPSDYRASHVGTIIAIINSKSKFRYVFEPKIWITND